MVFRQQAKYHLSKIKNNFKIVMMNNLMMKMIRENSMQINLFNGNNIDIIIFHEFCFSFKQIYFLFLFKILFFQYFHNF